MKKIESIDHREWSLIFGAMHYFMGGESAASASFPAEIVEVYWKRLGSGHKSMLARELKKHIMDGGKFGNDTIDEPRWMKFLSALDEPNYVTVRLVNGTNCKAFRANGRVYPLDEYVKDPHHEIYIPDDSIVEETPC